jgi:hypothetical protein
MEHPSQLQSSMFRLQITPEAAPNNGMHPTRDTPAVIYLQRLGRAGDAGRYAPCDGETQSGGARLLRRT